MQRYDPMGQGWCELNWTLWQPLDRQAIQGAAPTLPGVYRIRRAFEASRFVYIGQTGRTLRERLLSLARGAHGDRCPYNDPHTAAPYLWLIRELDGAQLQFSCAPIIGDTALLRGTEDMLLW